MGLLLCIISFQIVSLLGEITFASKNTNLLLHTNQTTYTVYITPYGECYHRKNCRTIKYSYSAVSKQKAIKMGRRACKVCRP